MSSSGLQAMFRWFKYSAGSAVAVFAAVAGLGGLNLYTYQRFTEETPVAALAFVEVAPTRFEATFSEPGRQPQVFFLDGDEWQLDVRMIKWSDWMTFLGEEPLYRLDRLSGRHSDPAVARAVRPNLHALSESRGIDLWSFARSSGDWLPGIDAAYGSSVYLPMRDGARYQVTMSRTGLVARPVDARADSQ